MAIGGGFGRETALGKDRADRARSDKQRDDRVSRPGGTPGRDRGQRTEARRLRESSDQNELLSNRDTVATTPVDPEPQSAEQIAARQAEVRRRGRGQTILSGKLGVAAGPNISRRTLGGL